MLGFPCWPGCPRAILLAQSEHREVCCSKLKLQRQLHRARPANLVQRIEAAVGAA